MRLQACDNSPQPLSNTPLDVVSWKRQSPESDHADRLAGKAASIRGVGGVQRQHLLSKGGREFIIIIYPLTARVVRALQMISQPVFSIFSVLHCPLGPAELQACPFPDVVFPPLPLSALYSSPFHCTLGRWFWPHRMNGRHDHTTAVCVSLRSSGGRRVVRLPAGSRLGLPRW